MHPAGADTVLVRHGDLATKSRGVQSEMKTRLVGNVAAILSDRNLPGRAERRWGRPRVHTEEESVEDVTDAVTDAFGVVSASPARRIDRSIEAIERELVDAASNHLDGGTFAVRVNRADKDLPYTSEDAERRGGAAVLDTVGGRGVSVDLDDPDLTLSVDVRQEAAFLFLEKRAGPGGLPLGSQSPMVALISGGIDSPVAAYETMRRGSPIVPVYFDLGPFGGPDHEARAIKTVRRLATYAPTEDLSPYRVPAGQAMERIAAALDGGRMLAVRRFMLRVAEHVASEEDAVGIVTGEALGQKSSQTAPNLAVTDAATDLPVHRPLFSWDKQPITKRAREIRTFADATLPVGCDRLSPDHPVTESDLETQRGREPDDLFAWAGDAADRAERGWR
jgi:thiamine biosynthesis protein ThiI